MNPATGGPGASGPRAAVHLPQAWRTTTELNSQTVVVVVVVVVCTEYPWQPMAASPASGPCGDEEYMFLTYVYPTLLLLQNNNKTFQ